MVSCLLQSKTSQPNSLGHRGDKQQQQQEAVQAQSSSQAGERTVQASTSTAETGGRSLGVGGGGPYCYRFPEVHCSFA